MSSVIKKPDGTLVVTVRLTLKPSRDQALIDLVQRAPPRRLARAIREAMRTGVSTATLAAEDDELLDLSSLALDL